MGRIDTRDGFNVLDGAALVGGAAIASIHILAVPRENLSEPGCFVSALTFSWLAVTAAGPFIFLVRRFARSTPHYPRVGDRLWALLGSPWLVTALLRSATSDRGQPYEPLFTMILSAGLAIVCLIALFILWNTWVVVPPEQAQRIEVASWTNRVGLILSIAWPIQCGLGLIIIG